MYSIINVYTFCSRWHLNLLCGRPQAVYEPWQSFIGLRYERWLPVKIWEIIIVAATEPSVKSKSWIALACQKLKWGKSVENFKDYLEPIGAIKIKIRTGTKVWCQVQKKGFESKILNSFEQGAFLAWPITSWFYWEQFSCAAVPFKDQT